MSPGAIRDRLRAWADEHRYDEVDHPAREVANLTALTTSAVEAGWTGVRPDSVYDRRAAAWDRVAVLGDTPAAAEEAAATRASASELRGAGD